MRRIAAILLVALALVSCRGGKDSGGMADMPVLYRTVPSDALALVYGKNASEVLSYYDSTSLLHSLRLENLSKARALLSINYISSQIPALSIDLGDQPDSSLACQAESLGLAYEVFNLNDGQGIPHRVAVTSVSEQLMKSIRRHIDENVSIADADCFDEVLSCKRKGRNLIVARGYEAARLLPKSFLSAYVSRAKVLDFTKKLSKWLVLDGDADDMEIRFVTGVSGAYFSTVLDSLSESSCKLDDVLPASTEFAVCLPFESVTRFRREYERFLNANVGLDRYRDTLAALKKRCGRSPLKWEGDLNVRELALVRTDSLSVLLVRPDRKPAPSELAENPYRRFITALYGKLFDIDDSCCATFEKWLVYGSEEDVRRFIGSERGDFSLPSACKALCLTKKWTIVAGDGENSIEFKR